MTTFIRSADGLELATAAQIKRIVVVDGAGNSQSTVAIRFIEGLPFVIFSCSDLEEAIEFSVFVAESIQGFEATGGGIFDVAKASALFSRTSDKQA